MDVEAILATSTVQHKSTEVNKEVELQFDLRNLLATDLNSLDIEALRYKIVTQKFTSTCSGEMIPFNILIGEPKMNI